MPESTETVIKLAMWLPLFIPLIIVIVTRHFWKSFFTLMFKRKNPTYTELMKIVNSPGDITLDEINRIAEHNNKASHTVGVREVSDYEGIISRVSWVDLEEHLLWLQSRIEHPQILSDVLCDEYERMTILVRYELRIRADDNVII